MKKILTTLVTVSLLLGASGVSADDAHEVKITADKTQFLYDVKEFTVKPGQKVKITLINPSDSVKSPTSQSFDREARKERRGRYGVQRWPFRSHFSH
jgi:plastocyanin